jgi:hypothetical protein
LLLQAAFSQPYCHNSGDNFTGQYAKLSLCHDIMAASQSSMQSSLVHNWHVCRWDEMIFSIFVMLAQVGLEAYILGTLFHYVVKKDAKLEEFR